MAASRTRAASTVGGDASSARRLDRRARRDQLISAAIPLVARHGPAELSLDDVAARAGVTRNLLYHYFPGGRSDLVGAVIDDAERQLLGPQPQRPGEAVSRVLDHALAPTHAWRIHRLARALPAQPTEVDTTAAAVEALRDFTGVDASPHTEVVLHGYLAYAEAVLDRSRVIGIPRADVVSLLARTLRAVVAAE